MSLLAQIRANPFLGAWGSFGDLNAWFLSHPLAHLQTNHCSCFRFLGWDILANRIRATGCHQPDPRLPGRASGRRLGGRHRPELPGARAGGGPYGAEAVAQRGAGGLLQHPQRPERDLFVVLVLLLRCSLVFSADFVFSVDFWCWFCCVCCCLDLFPVFVLFCLLVGGVRSSIRVSSLRVDNICTGLLFCGGRVDFATCAFRVSFIVVLLGTKIASKCPWHRGAPLFLCRKPEENPLL